MVESRSQEPNPSPSAESKRRADREYGALGLELLLFAVQSPVNIGMVMRVAEVFRFAVSIYDPHRVLEDSERLKTMEDFACGSLPRRSFTRLADSEAMTRHRQGRRLIVTSILPDAHSLTEFRFAPRDLIVLGNEYDGLPGDLVADADLKLHIPMPQQWIPKPVSWYPIDPSRNSVTRDGVPNLNVAMSAAIIGYSAYAAWSTARRG